MEKKMEQRDLNRMSVIMALFFSVDYMNYMVGKLFGVGGMMTSITIIGIVMVMCYKTIVKIKFSGLAISFALVVSLYYAATRQIVVTSLFGKHYLFYFCFASILGMYKCDTEKFLRYTSCMILLILPFYVDIYVEMNSTAYNTSIAMGLSYALLQILLAAVLHFMFYRKQSGVFMKILYCLAAFLLFNLLLKGTRGVALAVLCTFVFCFIHGIEKKRETIAIVRVVIIAILAWLVIVYFYDILEWLQKLLESWGIEAYFIEKIVDLQERGDVTNGRESIFEYTIKHIMDYPIFGHGLSSIFYNSNYRIVYPHNLFLQLLYDGGIVLTVPVLLVLGFGIVRTFRMSDKNEAVFMLFLMSISLPRMMFSGDIWNNGHFWLLIMHIMKFHVGKNKKEIKELGEAVLAEKDSSCVEVSNAEFRGDKIV